MLSLGITSLGRASSIWRDRVWQDHVSQDCIVGDLAMERCSQAGGRSQGQLHHSAGSSHGGSHLDMRGSSQGGCGIVGDLVMERCSQYGGRSQGQLHHSAGSSHGGSHLDMRGSSQGGCGAQQQVRRLRNQKRRIMRRRRGRRTACGPQHPPGPCACRRRRPRTA
jgi:hypothetical protein